MLRGGGCCGVNYLVEPLLEVKSQIKNNLSTIDNLDLQTLRQLLYNIILQKEQIQVQNFTNKELETLLDSLQTKIQSIITLDTLCSIYFLEILALFTTLFFQKLIQAELENSFRYLRDEVNRKLNQTLLGIAYSTQISNFEFILTYLHSKEELNKIKCELPQDFIGYYLPWYKQFNIQEQLQVFQKIIIESENQLIKYEELKEESFKGILIFKLNHCFDKIERLIQLQLRKYSECINNTLNSLYTQVIQDSTHWYIRNLWVRLFADLLIIRPQLQRNAFKAEIYNQLQNQNFIKTLDKQFFFIQYQRHVDEIEKSTQTKYSLQKASQMVNDIISLQFPIFQFQRASLNLDEKIKRIINQSQRYGIETIETSFKSLKKLNNQQNSNLENMQKAAEEKIICAFKLIDEFQNLSLRFFFSKKGNQMKDSEFQRRINETYQIIIDEWRIWIDRINELSNQNQQFNFNPTSLLDQFEKLKIFLKKLSDDNNYQLLKQNDLENLDLKIRFREYLNLTIIELFLKFCKLCVTHQNQSPQNSLLIISTGSILIRLSQFSLSIKNKVKFLMNFRQNLERDLPLNLIGQDCNLENNILNIIIQYDDAIQQLLKIDEKFASIIKKLQENNILSQYRQMADFQQIQAAQIQIINQNDLEDLEKLSQNFQNQLNQDDWRGISQENKLNFILQIFSSQLDPQFQNQQYQQQEKLRECEIYQLIRIINYCQENRIIDFALCQILDYLNENQNNQMEDLIIQSLTSQNRQYTAKDLNAILRSKKRQLEIDSQSINDDNQNKNISTFNNQSLKFSFLSFWKKLYEKKQDVLKNDQNANSGFFLPLKCLNPNSIKEKILFSDSSIDGFQLFFDAQNEKVLVVLGQLDNISLVKKAEVLIWKKQKQGPNSLVPISYVPIKLEITNIQSCQRNFIQQRLKDYYNLDNEEINDLQQDVRDGKVLIIFLLLLEINWNIVSLKQIVEICDQDWVKYKLLIFSKIEYFQDLELDYLHSQYQVVEIQDFNNQMQDQYIKTYLEQKTITKYQNNKNQYQNFLSTLNQNVSPEQAQQNGAVLQLTKQQEDDLNQSFFNKQNITQEFEFGYQNFLIQKIQQRLLDEQLIKIIKLSAQREELIIASSNAFYLYFKINRVFNNQDFTKIKIKDINISGCSFFKVNLSESVFENVDITRCSFTNCNLNQTQWKNMIVKEFSVLDAPENLSQLLILSSDSRSILYLDETSKKIIKYQINKINNSGRDTNEQDKQVYCFAVSQKEDLLALGHDDAISIWNTNNVTNKQTIELKGEKQIKCLYFQSDKSIIYCNSINQVIQYDIFNKVQEKILFTDQIVQCMTYSDQQQDLALGNKLSIILYNLNKKQQNEPLNEHQEIIEVLQFQMNTNYLISGSKDGQIIIWDPEQRQISKKFRIPNMIPLLITPDGKYVVYKNREEYLCIIDVQLQRQIFKLSNKLFTKKGICCLSKDGRKLAFQSDKKSIEIWDMAGFKAQDNIRDKIKCLEISPEDSQFAIGKFQQILICDIQGGMEIGKLEGHFGFINAIAYSSDAMRLVSAGDDKQIIYWDLQQYKKLQSHHHQSQILCVVISQNIEYIAFGDDKGMVKILSVRDFTLKYSKIVSQEQIKKLAFSNDQTQFYYFEGKKIKFCEFNQQLKQGEQIFQIDTFDITCFVISKDGKYLASGSNYNSIRISQLKEKNEQIIFYGHQGTITDLKFTTDYQRLWSCSLDSTIRLWDLKQKSLILQLNDGTSKFQKIQLILNDQYLISLDQEQSIRKWDIYRELSIDNYKDQINEIKIFSLSSDGVLLAYCGIESNFIVLDIQKKNEKCRKQCERQLAYLQFLPKSLKLITQYFGQQGVTIWDFQNDNCLTDNNFKEIKLNISTIISGVFMDGLYLAYQIKEIENNQNKSIKIMLYNIKQQKQDIELKGITKQINVVAQNYQNNNFIGFSKDENSIIVWDSSGNYVGKQEIKEKILAYSLDGEFFVYVIENKTIKYYKISDIQNNNNQSQAKPVKIDNINVDISSIIISQKNLFVGLNDKILKINDISKQIIQKVEPIYSNPKLMTLSSNGSTLAIYNKDNQLEFIKFQIQLINTVSNQSSSKKTINCVAYSKDGLRKAFGGIDQICIFFEKQQDPKFTIPTQTVKSIQFYQNGQKLISIQLTKIIIFDVNNGIVLKELQGMNEIISMSISYDETTLALAYEQAEIQIWNLQENLEQLSTPKTTLNIQSTGLMKLFNKTLNLLVVDQKNLIIYNENYQENTKQVIFSSQSSINNIAISFDDDLIAASFEDNSIILFKQCQKYDLIKCQSGISCIAFSNDAKILAFGRNDNFITFYQMESKQTFDCLCHEGKVTSIQFHPTNTEQFLSGGQDTTLKEWIFENTSYIKYNMKKKQLISISNDKQKFAFEDFHNRIQICDIKTKEQKPFDLQSKKILHLKFSRNGQLLAIIYDNYQIEILQVDNHQQILNQNIFNSNSPIESNSLIDFDFSNNCVLLNCCVNVNFWKLNSIDRKQYDYNHNKNNGIALSVSISILEDYFAVLTSSQKIMIYNITDQEAFKVIDKQNNNFIRIKFSDMQGQNQNIFGKHKNGKIYMCDQSQKQCQFNVVNENYDYLFMIQEESNETKSLIQDFLISNIELNPKLQILNLPSIKGLSVQNLERLHIQ